MPTLPQASILCSVVMAHFALSVVGCVSTEHAFPASETSEPTPVSPLEDNAHLLGSLMRSLVITIEINDSEPRIVDAHVAMVPKVTSGQEQPSLITIVGMTGGQRVTSTSVSDQRLNIQEGVGLVTLPIRTVTAALPLPEQIDSFLVQIPETPTPKEFDARPYLNRYCEEFPNDPFCS